MNAPLLSLDKLHTHIGHYHILHGASFSVPRGGVTVLLGRNGAGKSTTLRSIMGLWRQLEGGIRFDGQEIRGWSPPQIARAGIAYVPEDMGIFGQLSVAENMQLAARQGPLDTQRLEWIFGFFPALKKFWQSRAGTLSGGQKQMLAIARAVCEPRKLILIDEPTKGLAPAIVSNLREALAELKSTDTTILLVEQNFGFASRLGDSVAVMDDGRIVYTGTMRELADDAHLQQRLLGLSLAEGGH